MTASPSATKYGAAHHRNWQYLPYLILLALTLPRVPALPMWDSLWYFRCMLEATAPPYPFWEFACSDRPPLFLFLTGLPQYFFHGSTLALNLATITSMGVSIAGMWRLFDALYPQGISVREKAIFSSVFASAPLLIASTFSLSPDQGLLAFYPWVLLGCFRRQLFLTVIAGTCLVLSKETGVALYGIAWATTAVGLLATIDSRNHRRKDAFFVGMSSLPLFVFAFYLLARGYWHLPLWEDNEVFARTMNRAELNSAYGIIFVLNFSWLLWFVPVLSYLRRRFWLRDHSLSIFSGHEIRFLVILIVTILVLSRNIRFPNPRYFVTTYLLLLVFGYSLLLKSRMKAQSRFACLAVLLLLNVLSNYFSFDPVSIARFATSDFGGMRMYCDYSAAHWSCQIRDGLVYNQQHLEVQAAQNLLFEKIKPTESTIFLLAEEDDFFSHGALDKSTYERTERITNVFFPRFMTMEAFTDLRPVPRSLYVLEYPGSSARADLKALERYYRRVSFKKYGDRTKIRATFMVRR